MYIRYLLSLVMLLSTSAVFASGPAPAEGESESWADPSEPGGPVIYGSLAQQTKTKEIGTIVKDIVTKTKKSKVMSAKDIYNQNVQRALNEFNQLKDKKDDDSIKAIALLRHSCMLNRNTRHEENIERILLKAGLIDLEGVSNKSAPFEVPFMGIPSGYIVVPQAARDALERAVWPYDEKYDEEYD